MTELEKCLAGECYDCHDQVFLEFKGHARKLLKEYNALAYEQKKEKKKYLKRIVWSSGEKGICGYAIYL